MCDGWSYGAVSSLAILGENVWAGTANGLVETGIPGGNNNALVCRPAGLPGRASSITSDTEGNVWVANGTSAFYSANNAFRLVTAHNGTPVRDVKCVLKDRDNNTWYSTPQGLVIIGNDRSHNDLTQLLPKDFNVISMYEDESGGIWLGTFGNGVYRIDPGAKTVMHFTEERGACQ